MIERLTRRLYQRLGRSYRRMFVLTQVPAALVIATAAVVLLTSYYEPSHGQLVGMLIAGWVSTTLGIGYALWSGRGYLGKVIEWQLNPDPSTEESIAAWDGATNFPMRTFRANAPFVAALAGVPAVGTMMLILDLPIQDALVLAVATLVPIAYATVVNYFIAEQLMRPVIEEIAAKLPVDFPFTANGLLIRKRLKILLPIFTAFVGLLVAAVMTGHGGTKTLGESVAASIGVGLLLSYELTILLSNSVTKPIAQLRTGLARVRAGDYAARVPVITSDELGELSHDFNLMAEGLEQREEIRAAFDTYLDRDIVPFILSGNFPSGGIELNVSIMFVDVRGFTSFAERLQATEVVAALNALFERIVPIVSAHGGHVDKFLGDGVMVVFGAPEGFVDHADRAVAAGLELVRAVNDGELTVGVGINTGPVVAGSIGGAGRLNFSVIGDAVNVAARVESATRQTGDDLLITANTRDALTRECELVSRGTIPLKGKSEPVEVLACLPSVADGELPTVSRPVSA